MAEVEKTEKVKEKVETKKVSDKFAVIRTGGKQYLVTEGQTLEVELLGQEDGNVDFEVLLAADGTKTEIGTPLAGAKVTASVLGESKGDKQIVFKYKKRKDYRVKTGHRQHYSKVKIEKITLK